jgi:hypothetical protein
VIRRVVLLGLATVIGGSALAACDGVGPGEAITCEMTPISNGASVRVQDADHGLKSIVNDTAVTFNATVQIPSFASGTKNPVTVTATKVTPGSSVLGLIVTDTLNGTKHCDPTIVTVLRGPDGHVTQRDVPAIEHVVAIHNDSPGLRRVAVTVNGRKTYRAKLTGGEDKTIDIKKAMRSDGGNTLRFTGRGPKGASATVMIWDGNSGNPKDLHSSDVHLLQQIASQSTASQ